jgi:valyl-tRNA synthetase
MIEQYSADAVRYWAASTAIGKDATISEEKIQAGAKLVNKLWNVAKFSERFLQAPVAPLDDGALVSGGFSLADRWLLAHAQQLIRRVTDLWEQYDYATAKSETEAFFWRVLADNYLEMAKLRLYAGGAAGEGARYALYQALFTVLKLFAPILPHITEQVYQGLLAAEGNNSIHQASWPKSEATWQDEAAMAAGEVLVAVATAVRRFKSEHSLALGTELAHLYLATEEGSLATLLQTGKTDLMSITRAKVVTVKDRLPAAAQAVATNAPIQIALLR